MAQCDFENLTVVTCSGFRVPRASRPTASLPDYSSLTRVFRLRRPRKSVNCPRVWVLRTAEVHLAVCLRDDSNVPKNLDLLLKLTLVMTVP